VIPSAVIESIAADTFYDVPLLMRDERLDQVVLEKMQVTYPERT
jgi:CTP synthase